ncbi:MAG: DUF1501 domain-containing protein [Planctomycetes bacterium]|nr:DUF1501 domain-containing protein [Planctomycetota bacterium]
MAFHQPAYAGRSPVDPSHLARDVIKIRRPSRHNPTRNAAVPDPNLPALNRRSFLQVGYSGLLGLGLSSLLAGRAAANSSARQRRPKSVIIVFLTGAPSHLDMFDMKPDAPAEIRGEFRRTAARAPGLHVCEHLPRLAARSDKYAVVRSLSHREYNHLVATHHTLTGQPQPGAFFDKVASRDDWPSYASALDYLRPRSDGVPSGVNLPTFLMEGPLTWPGQHAGFLGPRHDPWLITRDPNRPEFGMDSLRPAEGIDVRRLDNRRALLAEVDLQQRQLASTHAATRLSDQQRLAFSILASGRIARAFAMDQEPRSVRDRYGRHAFGQSLLLARRLVEAGVPVVQANMGIVQNWDTHANNFGSLRDRLLPPLDQGVSALLDDLDSSGMLEDTLVMMLGEFGRTPRIFAVNASAVPGRDHWAPCYFGVFAGAGVQGGKVIGQSDRIGAFPATAPFSPDDVGATVYHVLGVNPGSEVRDRQNRPVTLNRGEVMRALFVG